MKKAYLILAHKQPQLLCRLIDRLSSKSSVFFVHIDRAAPPHGFEKLARFGENVRLIKQEFSTWAGIGIVKAVLNGLQAIDACPGRFDRIVLLSGQDYPIKSNEQIDGFFESSAKSTFMRHWEIPNFDVWPHRGGLSRVDRYFLGIGRWQNIVARTMNIPGKVIPWVRRRMPYELRPYGGWMWWTLDDVALKHILLYVASHPRYLEYHRYTFAPDEVFFQTILLNATDARIRESIADDDLRFIRWKAGESHPEILRSGDVEAALASPALFARKFDITVDEDALDLIDETLQSAA
jgi:hypothetical protein